MQGRSIYDYIYLGTVVQYLTHASPGIALQGNGFILHQLETLRQRLDEFDLPVSARAAWKIKELETQLRAVTDRDEISVDEAANLERLLREFRPTLDAEVTGKFAYIVTEKHLDVEKLLNNVEGLFAPGVFALLPSIARYDFMEGGQCIAFERPTAAAFHALRATEDVLRSFYCSIVKRKSERKDPMLWGPMLAHLAALPPRRRPTASLLSRLNYIRDSFRNPTQHPEAIYDIHQVQDLFNVCVEVVNRMAPHLV